MTNPFDAVGHAIEHAMTAIPREIQAAIDRAEFRAKLWGEIAALKILLDLNAMAGTHIQEQIDAIQKELDAS